MAHFSPKDSAAGRRRDSPAASDATSPLAVGAHGSGDVCRLSGRYNLPLVERSNHSSQKGASIMPAVQQSQYDRLEGYGGQHAISSRYIVDFPVGTVSETLAEQGAIPFADLAASLEVRKGDDERLEPI